MKQILKLTTNRREYHIHLLNFLYPSYWDEGINFHHSKGRKWDRRSWKKQITNYEYRMYRTWKYNRKNQWKQ